MIAAGLQPAEPKLLSPPNSHLKTPIYLCPMETTFKTVATATMVLFAVIDVVGSIPVIIGLKQKVGELNTNKASAASLGIMVVFLFIGEYILNLLGVEIRYFAIAGSFVLFFLAMEMILGIRLYKDDVPATASVVPLAFPLLAGTGTLTTLLTMRVEYTIASILIAILINVAIIWLVLKNLVRLEKLLGPGGVGILRKVFGIILLALAVKLFMNNAIDYVKPQ